MNQPASAPAPSSAPNVLHDQLAEALRERLRVIADRASYGRDAPAHLRQLQAASERIVALQAQLPSPVDPMLAHYLERSSFDKALAWLEEAGKGKLRHQ